MSRLLSVVIKLRVAKRSPVISPSGRDTQGWFLEQVSKVSPAMAEHLHEAHGPRPYTTSGLMVGNWRPLGEGGALEAGEIVFLRVTLLTEDLCNTLETALPKPGSEIRLQRIPLLVDSITCSAQEHGWAGMESYSGLVRKVRQIDDRQVMFEFASPTAFRSGDSDLPLPMPELILRSWWTKWNAFAPAEFRIDETWPQFARACVRVSRLHALNTTRWRFADGAHGAATGYYGDVGLTLLPQRQCAPEWAEHWNGSAQVLQALGEYSLFCGTGHHVTIGMGQTRMVG